MTVRTSIPDSSSSSFMDGTLRLEELLLRRIKNTVIKIARMAITAIMTPIMIINVGEFSSTDEDCCPTPVVSID